MIINNPIDKAKLQIEQARLKKAQSQRPGSARAEEINQVAEDFEAVFLSQMLEHMFAGVDPDPMTDGVGDDIYKSMLLEEYGKIIARSGGIGIADHVKREMLRIQEARQ